MSCGYPHPHGRTIPNIRLTIHMAGVQDILYERLPRRLQEAVCFILLYLGNAASGYRIMACKNTAYAVYASSSATIGMLTLVVVV